MHFSDQLQQPSSPSSPSPRKKPGQDPEITQLLLIQQQGDLINELMMKSQISSKKCHTFSTEISELSFDSFEKVRNLNSSISAISLSREYSRYFNEDSSEEVLDQIRKHCSRKTYNFVRSKLRASMESKCEAQLQKEIKANQQLTQRCLKLSQEVGELKVKLDAANEKLKSQQKKKHVRTESSFDRSEIYLKWQKSMLYKEKVQSEMKKSLNKQFQILEQQKKQNEILKQEIFQLLSQMNEGGSQVAKLTRQIQFYVEKQGKMARKREEEYHRVQGNIEGIMKELKDSIKNIN